MYQDKKLWIAQSENGNLCILPKMANRHGLIAGATGTGKTVTMKVMAESFSDMGIPVFFSDVKGDLTGMCCPGKDSEDMQTRIANFGIEGWEYKAYPTRFWDIFGETGHPVRVKVSEMGPTLIGRLFNLTDAQTGVLSIVFKVADDNNLLLIDLKDLRKMLQYVGDNRAEFTTEYGNVSAASIGAIQRKLLEFENEGGEVIFGEPALDIRDWMRTDIDGRGYINVLSSSKLIASPTVYATFLLWMLTDLYEKLPEVGDDKLRMVFFFDEAHLLFEDAPKALVSKIEQIVKLIRSKGIGIYFVTQNPKDIPSAILAQLSNKVQHCLRAYTPDEQKAVKAAAKAFRANPAFNTEQVLMELGTGEAIVSFLDEDGVPGMAERAKVLPPQSLMGAADAAEVTACINASEFELKYRESVDSESAYEIICKAEDKLASDQEEAAEQARKEKEEAAAEKQRLKEEAAAEKAAAKEAAAKEKEEAKALAAKEKEEAKALAAQEKAAAKEAAAAEKAAEKKKGTAKKLAQQATSRAASTVASAVVTNVVNAATGGKTTSAKTIAKRAATNALSSVARSSATSLIRGLFGNLK